MAVQQQLRRLVINQAINTPRLYTRSSYYPKSDNRYVALKHPAFKLLLNFSRKEKCARSMKAGR